SRPLAARVFGRWGLLRPAGLASGSRPAAFSPVGGFGAVGRHPRALLRGNTTDRAGPAESRPFRTRALARPRQFRASAGGFDYGRRAVSGGSPTQGPGDQPGGVTSVRRTHLASSPTRG